MPDYTKMYQELDKKICTRVSGFRVRFKDESPLMKVIGKILFFNKSFMTNYITTLGKTVYFPSRARFEQNPGQYFITLAHEYVHILDYVKHPKLFILKYIFPQCLSLLSLLAIFAFINPLFLLFLVSLLFAAPIPAPGRMQLEMRGYGMSCLARHWLGQNAKSFILGYTNNFTTSAYYFMWPFRKYVMQKLDSFINSDQKYLTDSNFAYRDVYSIINENL